MKLEIGWKAAKSARIHPDFFITGRADKFPELAPALESWLEDRCARHGSISFGDAWRSFQWVTKAPKNRQLELAHKLTTGNNLDGVADVVAEIEFEESPIIAPESKSGVDKVKAIDTFGGVRAKEIEVPTWPDLKKSVSRLTANRGSKSALAGRLGVTRQVLNNWLSAESLPNAVLTLELFRWVKEQEQIQK